MNQAPLRATVPARAAAAARTTVAKIKNEPPAGLGLRDGRGPSRRAGFEDGLLGHPATPG
jgi:hypothetical protein